MQLINNPADREFRFLQADLLIEEEHMEEADKILQQLAMDEEYELDTLLDIILDYVDVNQKEYAKKWIDCLFAHFDMQTLPETNQRLRDVLCDYYSTFNNRSCYPLPEHDSERVSLFRSALERTG